MALPVFQRPTRARKPQSRHRGQAYRHFYAFLSGGKLWEGEPFILIPEITEGDGLSGGVGIADFPNGEATRAGGATPEYDTARL